MDLLSNLKLENRIVYHKGEIEKVLNLDINWAKVDDRIKVVHKKNAGLGEARNSGLDVATGDYIVFFDM